MYHSRAEDLEFFANASNSQHASSITQTFSLPAGAYTLVLGGNPEANALVRREGNSATFAMQSVPEPCSLGWSVLTLLIPALRRKRRCV